MNINIHTVNQLSNLGRLGFEGIWNGPTSAPFQMDGCSLIWRYANQRTTNFPNKNPTFVVKCYHCKTGLVISLGLNLIFRFAALNKILALVCWRNIERVVYIKIGNFKLFFSKTKKKPLAHTVPKELEKRKFLLTLNELQRQRSFLKNFFHVEKKQIKLEKP